MWENTGSFLFVKDVTHELCVAANQFKSPSSKVIAFLLKSRDELRIKYREVKYQTKIAANDRRVVRESRNNWRNRAFAAEAELEALKKSAS